MERLQGVDRTGTAAGAVRWTFLRFGLAVVGVVLAMSAFGLWMVPGDTGQSPLSLDRLGLSLFMLLCGLCCLVVAQQMRRL
ncbi:hypothetical protein [Thetidibacter halocola]|uniref:Uncharacterized protein n=1 Tax=Thetidibacter halocola TaxID=2827239 RepID=A0A8J8B7Y6_9RHOB|nr:hypothetical protein [Thetidibacter halocola]MBS0124204.1 hypothetical protein [Thetidibacter halocola]